MSYTLTVTESIPYFSWCFDFFNRELFGNQLPRVDLVFRKDRIFAGSFDGCSIAINPNCFPLYDHKRILVTLVHEQVHLWQHRFGNVNPDNHHDAEWSAKMLAMGLTGSTLNGTSIIEGGRYDLAFQTLTTRATHWRKEWLAMRRLDRERQRQRTLERAWHY